MQKTSDEQPRSDQQQHRKRNLGHDQCVAPTPRPCSAQSVACSSKTLANRVCETGRAATNPNTTLISATLNAAKPNTRASILTSAALGTIDGPSAANNSTPQLTNTRPKRRGQSRKHNAFNQQLPDEFPTAGAERRTNRQFLVPLCRTHQQQIRDVRTRNQQQQSNRKEQDQQCATTAADYLFLQRRDSDVPAAIFAVWTTIPAQLSLEIAARARSSANGPDRA